MKANFRNPQSRSAMVLRNSTGRRVLARLTESPVATSNTVPEMLRGDIFGPKKEKQP